MCLHTTGINLIEFQTFSDIIMAKTVGHLMEMENVVKYQEQFVISVFLAKHNWKSYRQNISCYHFEKDCSTSPFSLSLAV